MILVHGLFCCATLRVCLAEQEEAAVEKARAEEEVGAWRSALEQFEESLCVYS